MSTPPMRSVLRMSSSWSSGWTRSALIGLSLLVASGAGLTWLGTDTPGAIASARGEGTLPAPRLISLTYGRYRPQGAPHPYLALRLKVLEPHGQVVGTQFETPGGQAAVADGGCGIGGRRNGQVEIFYMPFKLSAGLHEVTVTATGSACTSNKKTSTATRTFDIRTH
jgi:hypothetical protein